MEDNPQLKDHPVHARRDWKRLAKPLVLHGDGVPLTGLGKSWSKVMDVFSISSLLGRGSTRLNVFLIVAFFYFAVRSSCWHYFFRSSFLTARMVIALGMERKTPYTRRL